MHSVLGNVLSDEEYYEVFEHIYHFKTLPSMRLLWSAGKAVESNHMACFNCAYVPVDGLDRFSEILFVLTSGSGCGFSVESRYIDRLPTVIPQKRDVGKPVYVVGDSREGWADALRFGIRKWFSGEDVEFDYSRVRPAGSRLRTFGGRASGPEPLRRLLDFARSLILNAQGRKLRSIEVHDLVCMIGQVVVSGGSRRSSLISFSDLEDESMRFAKTGDFYRYAPHRCMANNSTVFMEKPSLSEWRDEFNAIMENGTGERGVFNLGSVVMSIPLRRREVLSDDEIRSIRTNPCGEIFLPPATTCNLSTVVCRPHDTFDSLLSKLRIAVLLGTYQTLYSDFSYLSPEWKDHQERERLLGVSLGGQFDCPVVRDVQVLNELRRAAIEFNRQYASRFGVRPSTSITCVKPDGNSSQLADMSPGIHPRYSRYYLRRVRISVHDPLFALMSDCGVKWYPETGQERNTYTAVLEFPIKSPSSSVVRSEVSARDQIEYWKKVRKFYCEHTCSCTVYVDDHEWDEIGNLIYESWDDITGGLSFLPKDKHVYPLAPYEPISREEYEKRIQEMPEIDFSRLRDYESDDNTTGSREYACVSGACEL